MNNKNTEPQRFGKGMLIVFWLLVLSALAYTLGNWEKRQYNPNQSINGLSTETSRIVELERNKHGHYVVNGFVNGTQVTFMLDTGATNVAVPEALAKHLKLHQGAAHQVITANGIARAYRTEITQLKVGNIELDNVRASITPGMTGSEILLGMSALKQLDFSQSGKTLTLTQYLSPKR